MRLKYNFIGLILACGLGLSSCNDSFLDRNPKDQLSDASFWYMSQPNRDSYLLVRQLPATHISYNYGKMPINASADAWYFTNI